MLRQRKGCRGIRRCADPIKRGTDSVWDLFLFLQTKKFYTISGKMLAFTFTLGYLNGKTGALCAGKYNYLQEITGG
jgi:hypothetical protein